VSSAGGAFVVLTERDPELYIAVLGGLELGAVVSTLSQPSAKTRLRAWPPRH
jgi:acyl-CoA synthetase (AMP-forming)/AMP-acid ligase II